MSTTHPVESSPLRIFVDADACPAKDEIVEVCKRHQCVPILVANATIPRFARSKSAWMEVVPGNFDAADDWIVAQAKAGDLVLTADLLLAQRLVKNHVTVMNFSGGHLSDDVIHDLVARREVQQYLREMSMPSHQPAPYGKQNRSNLKASLHQWIEQSLRAKK